MKEILILFKNKYSQKEISRVEGFLRGISEDDIKCEVAFEEGDQPVEVPGESVAFDGEAILTLLSTDSEISVSKGPTASKRRIIEQKGLVARYTFDDIIFKSQNMATALSIAKHVAGGGETVLIQGESGTGKELLAQSIHNASDRKDYPFIAINCAALPETLLESELFGYEPGSFTGARSKGKIGLFEQADKGTIFLDEIGDISLAMQARLLRTIQEMQVMRIGSDKVIDIDVRIISATNRDLEQAIEEGTFRRDLFYRLNVLPIALPPLRNRKEDILPLLEEFLGDDFDKITGDEERILLHHNWPGNVREIRNVAIYYKSLSSLPEYLITEYNAGTESSSRAISDTALPKAVKGGDARHNPKALELHVLSLIYDLTEPAHGPGRTTLVKRMKTDGVDIGDGKMREILSNLSSRRLIEVGRGRTGARITESGIKYLREQENTK